MNDTIKQQPEKAIESWDNYWQGDQSSPALSNSGVSHDDIDSFWYDFFSKAQAIRPHPRMVDIASGNGALPELAYLVFKSDLNDVTCVDSSAAAIANIKQRFPLVNGYVGDACKLPLEANSYDLVTSQFGVEYAGMQAIDQAIKLLAPGGKLGFIMHYQDGRISSESSANLAAINSVLESRFVALASQMFAAGFAAMAGTAERKPYDDAALKLAAVLPVVEQALETYGEDIAGGTVLRLYNDVGQIHSNLQRYESSEILSWLDGMQTEMLAYANRMKSMLAACIDAQQFEQIRLKFDTPEFELEHQAALLEVDTKIPLAWVITAFKL